MTGDYWGCMEMENMEYSSFIGLDPNFGINSSLICLVSSAVTKNHVKVYLMQL